MANTVGTHCERPIIWSVCVRAADRGADLSVLKHVTAGQDETFADVNKAFCGANKLRDRWLKERAHQCLRTQCDDVRFEHLQQLFTKSALRKVTKPMTISATIITSVFFFSKRMNCSGRFHKMLGIGFVFFFGWVDETTFPLPPPPASPSRHPHP